MMMNIERLKKLRAILERNSELEDEQIEILWELIDTAIARQLVKSEEVAEAIDLLMELQHDNYVFQNYTEQDIKNYGLISIAITALQAYEPWVSVSERLPDDGIPVLVTYIGFNDGKLYSDGVAKWSIEENGYNGGWLWEIDGSETTVGITHWKPLPEPPKGE